MFEKKKKQEMTTKRGKGKIIYETKHGRTAKVTLLTINCL
jgi:hypothetical protein